MQRKTCFYYAEQEQVQSHEVRLKVKSLIRDISCLVDVTNNAKLSFFGQTLNNTSDRAERRGISGNNIKEINIKTT